MFYFRLTAYSLYAAVSVGLQVIFKSEYNHVLIKTFLTYLLLDKNSQIIDCLNSTFWETEYLNIF